MFHIAAIKGECNQMCPESEIKMREEQRLLHPLEILDGKHNPAKADRCKMVKEFCRSSAGQDMQKAEVLRPYNILMDTLTYLLHEVIGNNNFPWHIRYEFIADRLRAIRQDMIIQDIPKPQSICLLQPIVRFYAYASYRLGTEKLEKFDPHLNQQHFQECVKRLLVLYDECEEVAERCCQNNLGGLDYSSIYADARPQIEAMYVLFNLGKTEALNRCLSLSSKWRSTDEVQSALKLALYYHNNNFVIVFKLIKKLRPLLAVVAWQHLPILRKQCLEIMCYAYNSKILKYPLEKLQDTLIYGNQSHLLEDLNSCNIKYEVALVEETMNSRRGHVEGDQKAFGSVHFVRCAFKDPHKLKVTRENFIDDLLNYCNIHELILYN